MEGAPSFTLPIRKAALKTIFLIFSGADQAEDHPPGRLSGPPGRGPGPGRLAVAKAIRICQGSVTDRLTRDGHSCAAQEFSGTVHTDVQIDRALPGD
jgi:hypothetical protein